MPLGRPPRAPFMAQPPSIRCPVDPQVDCDPWATHDHRQEGVMAATAQEEDPALGRVISSAPCGRRFVGSGEYWSSSALWVSSSEPASTW